MKTLLLIALSIVSITAQALPGDDCPGAQILFGRWAFNRQFTKADGCLVQATPIEKRQLVYREYVFDQSGRFLIFDSTDGPFETATSQHNYFILPAKYVPSMEIDGEQMIVTSASGTRFAFSKESPEIVNVSDDIVITATSSTVRNYTGILLDTGRKVGTRAYRNKTGISHFSKNGRKICSIRNAELFAYADPLTGEEYYQPIFRYPEPGRIEAFLSQRCPNQ